MHDPPFKAAVRGDPALKKKSALMEGAGKTVTSNEGEKP